MGWQNQMGDGAFFMPSRFIPTLTGTEYGTLDTAITFTGDFEVEVEFATTANTVAITSKSTSNESLLYIQAGGEVQARYANTVGITSTTAVNDGKVHTALMRRIGTTNYLLIDGIEEASNTQALADAVFDLVGNSFSGLLFNGQILSTKFTDKSGAEDVETNYVFDSGSTVEQYARGSETLKVTFTNFTSANWSRYTLQRNITHDAGTITEAWVGDNDASNPYFDTDTVWTKGTGWTISGGNASCDGTQVGATDLEQDISQTAGDIYLVESTISGFSAGTLTQNLGGASGSAKSADGKTTEVITTTTTANLAMQGDVSFVGNVDNVTAKHLLELA